MKKEELEEAQVPAPFASLEEAMNDKSFRKWIDKVFKSGIPLKIMGSNVPDDNISKDLRNNNFGGLDIGATKSLSIATVATIIKTSTDKLGDSGYPYDLFMAKVVDYMYNTSTVEE